MDQLLTTKLYIPQLSPNLVPRPQLYARLDGGLRSRLTLVSAPTGFGKSTVVTGWLSDRDQPAAWLSLDPGDNDPVRFWTYLIAAVQTLHPQAGVEARQILTATQSRGTEPAVISLINDIAQYSGDLVVVLDDYHIIAAEGVHAGINYLLEHQPPNFHLLLLTRVDPAISLARLRVHGQLVEIRAEDLQFSTAEAATLFNEKMGLDLRPEQIEALNAHTESWAVGLQLAALSLQGQPSTDTFIQEFTGGHQFILDYLAEEVLEALPAAQHDFLLRTSVLERFCGDLCQAVTDDPSSQSLLDDIRRRNLFLIPLDREGRWYRYHHLFAEVLAALLARDHPGEISELHLKASAWFDDQGHPGEAVDHALRSGDRTQAREQICKHWMTVIHLGEIATLLRWLDALPEGLERDDPIISLARCWALFLSGDNTGIEPYLEQANNAYERLVAGGELDGVQQDTVAAQIEMMRSVLARSRGDHASSVAHAESAARLVSAEMLAGIGTGWNMLAAARAGAGDFDGAIQAYERGIALAYEEGNLVGAYGCTYGQAMYLLIQGRLDAAEELCQQAIARTVREGHGDFPAVGSLYITMARLALERNRLKSADTYLDKGLRIALPGGFGEAARIGHYIQAQLAAAHGDHDTAADLLVRLERVLDLMDDPYLSGELNAQWTNLLIKTGELETAREKLHVLEGMIATTQHANLLLWRGGLLPRLLYAEGRSQAARIAVEESIQWSRAGRCNGELIRLLALQAVILDALGQDLPARSALLEAISLGAPGGYVGRWLDAGPAVIPLLGGLRESSDPSQAFVPYLDILLDAFRTTFGEQGSRQPTWLPEPLTPRELEVVRLICQGYSNPEIASELVVSVNTIKKHTSNIYGKLGVRSRTQAIARALEVGLV